MSFKNEKYEVISGSNNELFFDKKIVPMWVPTKIAASMLGISPNALRIRKCRGEVDCKYFGRELRFNVSYLSTLFKPEKNL